MGYECEFIRVLFKEKFDSSPSDLETIPVITGTINLRQAELERVAPVFPLPGSGSKTNVNNF